MKKAFSIIGILLLCFIAVILFRTFTFQSKQITVQNHPALTLNDSCVHRLQEAIRFKTISFDDPKLMDSAAFLGFQSGILLPKPIVLFGSWFAWHVSF